MSEQSKLLMTLIICVTLIMLVSIGGCQANERAKIAAGLVEKNVTSTEMTIWTKP